MTSRQRLLAAMDLEQTDRLPLYCLWRHGRDPFNHRDQGVDVILYRGWYDMPDFWGVGPVQGEADLDGMAAAVGGKLCVPDGMNGNLTLSEGTPDEVRAAEFSYI